MQRCPESIHSGRVNYLCNSRVKFECNSTDVVGQQANISASSTLFSKNGAIFTEAVAAFNDESGSLREFLFYPLDDAWKLSQTEKQAELFARLGVLYLGDPQRLQEIMPNAYKIYSSIFAANNVLDIRESVRGDTEGNREVRGELEEDGGIRGSYTGSISKRRAGDGLASFREAIAKVLTS